MNHSNADKWAKKSYEEIHILVPKQKFVVNGELVPVTALPPCAHEVFNVPKLNHVQSKAFPIANEPTLLCAPTSLADRERYVFVAIYHKYLLTY